MFIYVIFPVNALSKQKRAMRRGMRNLCGPKTRYYAACIIDLNDYLDIFHGAKASDNICETELNEIFFEHHAKLLEQAIRFAGF